MSGSSGAPCGACKFLRRKCVKGCIFAPYFGSEQGAARFAAVHKIFGASNVSKLLLQIPSLRQRCDAVLTISYEAQARLSDPVYGCVATIFALQQQVASLQAELAIVQAQLASRLAVAALNQQHCSAMPNNASFYDNSMPSPTAISMSLPNSGSSTSAPYCRVKEEIANYQGHLQVFDLGMPASIDHVHSAQIDNPIHKSGERSLEDEESSELQALAHALLCRK